MATSLLLISRDTFRPGPRLGVLLLVIALSACSSQESSLSSSTPAVSADVAAGPAAISPTASASSVARYRGLWVLCEGSRRTLEDPRRIEELIRHAHALEVTDLFVQVYRGGRAWYDADLADATPFRAIVEAHGIDPLSRLIERAHAEGLRVHAWVNVLTLSRNRDAPILARLGPAAVQVDRKGRSILDYPRDLELPPADRGWYRVGTPGVYLDPAAPGVSESLVAVFRQLVSRYPDLDGLHLDYSRYPGVLPFSPGSQFGVGLDFGYGEPSRQRFRRESGLRGPYPDPAVVTPSRIVNATAWDAWRREKVTDLVRAIGKSTAEVRPGLRLSAAVIAYADRAYLSLGQDWRGWLKDGLVDFVVPMVYSKDDRLFDYQVTSFSGSPDSDRIWIGVGVWLFASDPAQAIRQLDIAGAAGVAGDALFSYDSIVEASAAGGLLAALSKESENEREVP